MLSILIPIYNFDCRKLVQDLVAQCEALGIAYEILCFDDCSLEDYRQLNASLSEHAHVSYHFQTKNLGRARNRNALAAAAQYEYLLFMDGDSGIVHERYIADYIRAATPTIVLYGGTFYPDKPPKDSRLYLHWKVGRAREQMPASTRQAAPYSRFTTNNFLVPKSLFQRIQFDASIRQYGHEDTLFAQALQQRGIPILHLDNPLEHIGLEANTVFLEKSERAIQNLVQLAQAGKPIETRLYAAYLKLKEWNLLGLYRLFFRIGKSSLRKNLLGKNPTLKSFDLYKLGILVELV